ncbi:unnamed protein product [Rotaria magnacalcarata]|uniref:Calponin-homology (CH) domain-containing protein n=3 Tax=Rotaria magnacalcarata TaxID=392030 RepID=A0A816TKG8_9BILA|nr:unnamed protein product [Rotaria magnacalcarata]CAF1672822.1 unnamed protein product [Rotaria magnacalcarata]CAF1937384.1 unnamed protein product [Rotaria magnacalcarata]CAF2098934.1 unnamed protein product [Rotaria magnacalcarata]CAF4016042.1 unnamed protein product [Rotaria magnacalcarata]
MVARTAREILRWLESLYLTYPIVVPKWDLSNGYAYAEILHAYFPNEISMFTYLNGRSLNSRLSNWSLIKQFIARKKIPISNEFIDATVHGKDGGAERLLEQTYELFTNKKAYIDPTNERTDDFTDYSYQRNLHNFERAHTSKSLKNNLKVTELITDPSDAYRTKKSADILYQSKLDREKSRVDNPDRFDIKPTLAERCLRKPLRPDSTAQDWYIKSFDSRSRSATSTTVKSNSFKQQSRETSADVLKKSSMSQHHNDKGLIQADDNNLFYKEIVLKQHSVPLSDLMQINQS